MTFNENDVYCCIGSVGIEQFDTEKEIEEYFTNENFIDMFGHCFYTDSELYDLIQIAIRMWETK